jgi:beta-glucanase (GH16 family)
MKYLSGLASWALLLVLVQGFNDAANAAPPRPSTPDCGAKLLKPNGQALQCTFADDFGGTVLDAAKWQPLTTATTNLHGAGDCWVTSRDNISVSGGFLHLTSRRENDPFSCVKANTTSFDAKVTSGSVTSHGRFAQAYGRWDIRARFPNVTLPGSQGALWLTPYKNTYGAWPLSGEIDIAEFYSLYPDRAVPYIHYKLSSVDSTITNTRCYVSDPWNFHTYSLVWTSGRLVISIDGATCVDHKIHAAAPLTGSQPFDKPFVINLTQTLGQGNNAPSEGTPLPLTTDIDYVRVWK